MAHHDLRTKIAPLLALLCVLGALRAQDAAQPEVDLRSKQAQQSPSPAPTAAPNQSVPELSRLDEMFKQTPMGKAADTQRLRVEWRQLQNKVVNDPDLIAMKHAAEGARTDLEKRELLRSYYKSYYARLRRFAMSSEMKQYIDAMEASHLGLTAQSRVRPTPSSETH